MSPTPLTPDESSLVYDLAAEAHAAKSSGQTIDLAAICHRYPHLRPHVEAVLHAGRQMSAVRRAEPAGVAEPIPSQIGRYVLAELVGRGGMGVVYRGRDAELDRDIAIKLLRSDHPADDGAVRRFTDEAKITAKLQHPGIPAVHELGTLPDGRPYLAMKLIRGRTLAELLRERGHGSSQWLGVFETICQAVGAAHAAGYVHRDLKPGNVMVGAFGEVQVMDWGLAKQVRESAVGSRNDERESGGESPIPDSAPRTSHSQDTPPVADLSSERDTDRNNPFVASEDGTRAGTVLGTPSYMAPEQARGEVSRIDRRSDVFALGAILCEVLTGKPPLSGTAAQVVEDCAAGRFEGAYRRLDECGEDRELIALTKRCLAGEPGDRPADASDVATAVATFRAESEARAKRAEVERAEVAVQVTEQRKRKWVWRVAAAVLAMGVIGTSIGLLLANHAADKERTANAAAQTAKSEAEQAAFSEKVAKEKAQRQLSQIEHGVELFAGMLRGINPRAEEQGGPPLYDQLRVRAEKAAEQLQAEAIGDRLSEAKLQTVMGDTLLELGSRDQAIVVLERARTTRERELGPGHLDTLTTLYNLSWAYRDGGRLKDAIGLLERVRDGRTTQLGAEHPDTLTALHTLAWAYWDAERFDEAAKLYERVRDARLRILGADHTDTLATLNNLALVYRDVGRLPDTVRLIEQVRDAMVRTFGADHPDTLTTVNNLGGAYRDSGRPADAIVVLERVRDTRTRKLGAGNPSTLVTLQHLALAYRDVGRTREAIDLLEQVRETRVQKLGASHPQTLSTLSNLGSIYCEVDQGAKAGRVLKEYVAGRRKQAPEHDPGFTQALAQMGTKLLGCQQYEASEEMLRECLAAREKFHPDQWTTFETHVTLGRALVGQKRYPEAEPLLLKGITGLKAKRDSIPPKDSFCIPQAIDQLVSLYAMTGRFWEATAWQLKRNHFREPLPAPRKAE